MISCLRSGLGHKHGYLVGNFVGAYDSERIKVNMRVSVLEIEFVQSSVFVIPY